MATSNVWNPDRNSTWGPLRNPVSSPVQQSPIRNPISSPVISPSSPTWQPAQEGQVGVQLGAGNIGFGANPINPTSHSPSTTGNYPAYGQAPIMGTPAAGFGGSDSWLNSMAINNGPYSPNMTLSGPAQAWQSFKFDNPTEDWMRNANSIADPVTRMQYLFSQPGAQNNMGQYFSKAGLSNSMINDLRAGFGTRGSGATQYLANLGVNQGANFGNNIQQVGNQLWSIDPRTRQRTLIQDFGNSGNVMDSSYKNSPTSQSLWNDPSNQWLQAARQPRDFEGNITKDWRIS